MSGSLIHERELLETARGGDERAFQSLVAPRHGGLADELPA
jgi:hypothetical protein